MDFDTGKFIIEVESRPAIWNTNSPEYFDKKCKQLAWAELEDNYGGELLKEEKKELGLKLQKKWRNIRDSFVKAHRAIETKTGSVAKKKIPYAFYDNLLFLKDTVTVNTRKGRIQKVRYEDVVTDIQEEDPLELNVSLTKRRKQKRNIDPAGNDLPGVSNRNLERSNFEDDDDRLFFLSMVKEFKKIPENKRLQTRLDLLKVIKDAQFSNYPDSS